ncbi:hypothetical protein [Sorangium sp. So ce131]|uniref:hypothetical protein n=1 Tax=Sorangium sp. So ce131 TaxID=3133282 RepID=UPI003F6421C4
MEALSMGDEAITSGKSARSPGFWRWSRVLPALLLVGSATFVAAYYVPLRRAHLLLIAEQQTSSQKAKELEQTLSQVRGELDAKTAQVEKLEAERRQIEAARRSGLDRVEQLKTELSGKLDKQIKKGVAAIAVADGQAVVALPESAVFAPYKLDVSPQGQLLLCHVASALSAGNEAPIRVGAVSGPPDQTPPVLLRDHPTPWSLSAARAASVAQVLEEKCAVKGARLSAVGHAGNDPAGAALAESKLPAGRVELAVALPSAPADAK